MSIENEIKSSKKEGTTVFIYFLAVVFFLWGFVMLNKVDNLQRKYDVLVETAIARHDGQVAMEAMMNAKASDNANEIREAIAIVYDGKKPENKE